MTNDQSRPSGFSLRRWSTRKHEVRREGRRASSPGPDTPLGDARPEAAHVEVRSSEATANSAFDARNGVPVSPADAAQITSPPPIAEQGREERGATAAAGAQSSRVPLPSIDTLSIDSDYSPFMQTGVDETVKRGALKKLFSDPRFNVMDGLDVYIDDYSKPDPIDPDIVRTLVQARYIFNPPATRVNEQGYVEDVQDDAVQRKREPDDAEALSAEPQDLQAVGAESQHAGKTADTLTGEVDDAETLPAKAGAADTQSGEPEAADTQRGKPKAGDRLSGEPEAAQTLTLELEKAEALQSAPEDGVTRAALAVHRGS